MAGDGDKTLCSSLAAALAARPGFAGITAARLTALPAKGLVHDHFAVFDVAIDDCAVLLRVPRRLPTGMAATAFLTYEAAGFARAAPSGHVPRLFGTIAPTPDLPHGALLVESVAGQPPRLPGDMAAIATALAAIHALPMPVPTARPPLGDDGDPVAATLARIEAQARALPCLVLSDAARHALDVEIDWARAFAAHHVGGAQPRSLVVTDTHPGNFLIGDDGRAICVDLEKTTYGAIAFDLAHASLPISTRWDPDCATLLTRDAVVGFYRHYLTRLSPESAAALAPWLLPARRLIWLRTMTFCAKWFSPRGASRPDDRLDPAMRRHLAALLADIFSAETIAATRAEWLGSDPLIL